MIEHIAKAFLEVLSQHSLIEDDAKISPCQTHVHPTVRGQWTTQFFDENGLQSAEGIYTGNERSGVFILEWARTPGSGSVPYGVRHHFDADQDGVLHLRREVAMT